MRVVVNGILFEVNEQVIAKVGVVSLEGRKWSKKTCVTDEVRSNQFF